MKILFAASECVPLIKTGGLADVAGALPKALAAAGMEVRVLLPGYRSVLKRVENTEVVWESDDLLGRHARVLATRVDGVAMLLLDIPELFDRDGGPYLDESGEEWADNPLRFGCFSKCAAEIATHGLNDGWRPDVLHVHDWQAALAPTYLAGSASRKGIPVPTILTIHNMAYQGACDATWRETLRLAKDRFTPDGYEFWGRINALKAGLVDADAVTTVSPTYARELLEPSFGFGLEGVLRARAGGVVGILNGIDLEAWDPSDDPAVAPFDAKRLTDRRENKRLLSEQYGLTPNADAPLFGVVSRLTDQKGLDLLMNALPTMLAAGGRLVLLGSGDRALETAFRRAAADHPDRIGVRIGYDEDLAHRIYAGADAILVPSRFEPCGLTQMYAMRYGALPVVARTGGLADSIIDGNDAAIAAGVATGFQFTPGSTEALSDCLLRVIALYADKSRWAKLQRNALRHPVGWDRSAAQYVALYRETLARKISEKKASISRAAKSGSS
jgi:starch synthase